MFGSHLSIAGSMLNALDEAEKLGLDTVQVFTKNQQQWKSKPLDPAVVKDWRARIAQLGWQDRTVSHASYLINLGSPNDELWRKSIDLMTEEIERCETLGIPLLVHHPGAFTTSTREEGIARIVRAYKELFKRTKGYRTISCLENTVGGGSTLGGNFGELHTLRTGIAETTGQDARVGICFDTCHAHAGGYPLHSAELAEACLAEFDQTVGLEWIRVLHMNDSKAPAGSKRDLHEHIGQGTIGKGGGIAGFGVIVRSRFCADKPKILETPKGLDPNGVAFDTLNLRRLRGLLQGDEQPLEPGVSSSGSGKRRRAEGSGRT